MHSFWMGGFEGADHVNRHGEPLDLVAITGHAADFEADYARLAALGLRGARESLGWRLAEPAPGRFDFTRAVAMAAAARRQGVSLAWTLMHYGVPADVNLVAHGEEVDASFVARFADYAEAAVQALAPHLGTSAVFTPINEISYLAWAVCESNAMHPHVGDRADPRWKPMPDGFIVKRRLVAASLAAMARIRRVCPDARFLHIDPIVHVVPPAGASSALVAEAARFRDFQWQAWDMLLGRLCPELGGHDAAVDLIGLNHYATAQWEFGTGRTLAWPGAADARRLPFRALLAEAWQRYGRPLVVAETGHWGALRATWLAEIAHEVRAAMVAGVPVQALCLYPAIDRPDWDDTSDWHRSGLWDAGPDLHDRQHSRADARHLEPALAAALRRAQALLPPRPGTTTAAPTTGKPSPAPTPSTPVDSTPMRHHPDLPLPPALFDDRLPLVVLSHLRWDFVYQRPQHLLSRIARHRRVLFIEEPVRSADGASFLEVRPGSTEGHGVEVLRPHTPIEAPGFDDAQLPLLAALIGPALAERDMQAHVLWLYTPLALPLADALRPRALLFDCMDELSAFRHAPPQLVAREAALMRRADVVFTGGPALYEARRDRHPNVHCVPSSVDAAHFLPPGGAALASDAAATAQALQGGIAGPRLGWFGVIDERTDLALVAALADADRSWQVVMVGPVVKIDPATLPARPNLHWLGGQPYDVLPHLVAGWDVCIMPFALNESTRFISPTKTLEYLAAGKPVVSTAVRDVGVLYGDAVAIARDAPSFVAACRAALAESGGERTARLVRGALTVAKGSWDETAARVEREIEKAVGEFIDEAPVEATPDIAASKAAERSVVAVGGA